MASERNVKHRIRPHNGSGVASTRLRYRHTVEKSKYLPCWKRIPWQICARRRARALFLCVGFNWVLVLLFYGKDGRSLFIESMNHIVVEHSYKAAEDSHILLPRHAGKGLVLPVAPLSNARGHRDFGDLLFRPRAKFEDPIPIVPDEYVYAERARQQFLDELDEESTDDKYQPESSREDANPVCRKVSWGKFVFPNCNVIHEKLIERVGDEGYDVDYIRSGAFRDAFRFQRQNPPDHFVEKRIQYGHIEMSDIDSIRKEALILERLTHSPRVLDIYGYCSTTVLLEPMASDLHFKIVIDDYGLASQAELDKLDDVYPLNNLTISEKLEISLQMAESLADLHGFEGGTIIQADTHIEQWLLAFDGSVKLNDFNNAREPTWNERTGEYCKRRSVYGGIWRSPEEYNSKVGQDEAIDTFAFGQSVYTLLTGLWPWYDEDYRGVSHSTIKQMIKEGKKPFVDPRYRIRSLIEKRLVEIMEKCWAKNAKDRPTMFEVVKFLRNVKKEVYDAGELKPSNLIRIPMPP